MKVVWTLCMAMVAVGILAGISLPVRAAGEDIAMAAAKKRIELRIAEVHALRVAGNAGENNQGLLSPLGTPTGEGKAVIAAENRDRVLIYTAVAQKTGSTPEMVGAQRAKRIAEIVPRGTKIQDANGTWTTKK